MSSRATRVGFLGRWQSDDIKLRLAMVARGITPNYNDEQSIGALEQLRARKTQMQREVDLLAFLFRLVV